MCIRDRVATVQIKINNLTDSAYQAGEEEARSIEKGLGLIIEVPKAQVQVEAEAEAEVAQVQAEAEHHITDAVEMGSGGAKNPRKQCFQHLNIQKPWMSLKSTLHLVH